MKTTTYILAISVCIAGISQIGCKLDTNEKGNAIENRDLLDTEAYLILKANDEEKESQIFIAKSNKTILDNDAQISKLKKDIYRPNTTFDTLYGRGIDEIYKKNRNLKKCLMNYEINQTDSESFKKKFNSDAEVIAAAFKDLPKNKKK